MDNKIIGKRLITIRGAKSQSEMATKFGVHTNTWARYERGERPVDADSIDKLLDLGVSIVWLIKGNGPMLLADVTPIPPTNLDPERLELAITTVEEGLSAKKRSMSAAAKAQLVVAVYDLIQDSYEENSQDKKKLLKLIKSIA